MKTLTAEDEAGLIARAREGSDIAFTTLYNAYVSMVRKVGRKLLPWSTEPSHLDDFTQDVFMLAFTRLPQYRGENCRFSTWLTSIARNQAFLAHRDSYRKRACQFLSAGENEDDQRVFDPPDPKATPARVEGGLMVGRMLNQLAEECPISMLYVRLKYVDGMTAEEIAKMSGESLETVKSTIHRAHKKLRLQFNRSR